ncbi:glucan biosynthesis protein [Halopseudomonas salina]|uniref:Glucans biosynthesis protein D n=1 Tax=Halopseudomonas salina TaxID=1323744 RepID=A0ABQ1Q109_9GAMM|nr:glucan biosynthesis protein [Halopseudomonas salina]GGD09319.1 putative glucans biosynthesis protein D [Halopseudomonas salina]
MKLVLLPLLTVTLLAYAVSANADTVRGTVVAKAESLSREKYQAPPEIPGFLQNLNYDQYQGIRFKPQSSLWQETDSKFKVMLVPPGLFYTHPVQINVVSDGESEPLPFNKSSFDYPSGELEQQIPADLGYAGFKLTFPLKGNDLQNQFLVFAGASYYRAVSRDTNFGLSGRGLAINTGLPGGEEFPAFIEYWLETPKAGASSFTFHALLDGPSMTGAYQYTVTPGDQTTVEVKSVVFPRKNVKLLGIAPLTSMFYYGENTLKPHGEWRPEVHDSDGLLIHDGVSDEWLWRPLLNPVSLTTDYFATDNVRGFGLMQRDVSFTQYMDKEARYDTRPSAWVEPVGDWGKGNVVLVQLPTKGETNDNIVAFWQPAQEVVPNEPLHLSYTTTFGDQRIPVEPLARTMATHLGDGSRVGGGNQAGAVRVIVDFAGGALEDLVADAPVVASVTGLEDGEIISHFVEYLEPLKQWRLSILARPADEKPLTLRGFLSLENEPVTETWTYQLPRNTGLLGLQK